MTLPNRRPCDIETFWHGGERFHASVGTHPETGQVCEIFAYGPKAGSNMWALVQDICWMMSKQLQNGVTPQQLAKCTVRDGEGNPASLHGVLTDLLVKYANQPART